VDRHELICVGVGLASFPSDQAAERVHNVVGFGRDRLSRAWCWTPSRLATFLDREARDGRGSSIQRG
jgi:hypothetical protein